MPGVQREKDCPQAVLWWVDKLSQVGTHHLHALGGRKHNKLVALLRGEPKTFPGVGGGLLRQGLRNVTHLVFDVVLGVVVEVAVGEGGGIAQNLQRGIVGRSARMAAMFSLEGSARDSRRGRSTRSCHMASVIR